MPFPFGTRTDEPASTDTGNFSLISLVKRGLQSLSTIAGSSPPPVGPQLAANSSSVTVASDSVVRTVGDVASGVADSGAPVKVAAVYSASLPVFADGNRGNLQIGSRGALRAEIYSGSTTVALGFAADNSDAQASNVGARAAIVVARSTGWNGATFDRLRSSIVAPTATLTGWTNTLPFAVYNSAPTLRTEGQGGPLQATAQGALICRPFAGPDLAWSYGAAVGGILNTTAAVTVKAAAAAGIRNYITGAQISTDALGTATEFAIRDGAGGPVLYRMKIGTAGLASFQINFDTPLRGSSATLLEVVTLTATTTGAVYVNLQGYTAP
jgi:hypothetical protein